MTTVRIYSISGRMARRPYAVAILGYLALMLAIDLMTPNLPKSSWYGLAGLFVIGSAALATMTIRRLHDINRPGSGVIWTFAPLCECAAMVSLSGGAYTAQNSRDFTIVIGIVSLAFGIWAVLGTGWLMKTRGTEGENAYGADPNGLALPDTLVAGGDRVVLAGGKLSISHADASEIPPA